MILKQLEFINFRYFEHQQVELDPHLNVFVGGNGSGKTTLLHGVVLALAPILSRLPFEKRLKVPALAASDIRLVGEDRSAPYAHVAAVGQANGDQLVWDRTRYRDPSPATKSQGPRNRLETKDLFDYVDRITDAHNAGKPYTLPVFAYYGTNRAVDVPHYRLREQVLPTQFRRLAGLEKALDVKADFRRAVGWFNFFEQREFRERRDGVLHGLLPALDCVRRALGSMIPQMRNPRIEGTGRFAVDMDDPAGTPIKLLLDQLSDGYQVMLGVVMDFALRLALANPPDLTDRDPLHSQAVLAIDEVDLHLHPAWQQTVIPDLRRTFPNTQLILSTHSPQVISTVPAASLRVIQNDKGAVRIDSPALQTRGVESADVLARVMGVDPIPTVPEAQWLRDYRALIDEGQAASDPAVELRAKLLVHFGEHHPLMLDCDRLIRFYQFKKKRAEGEKVGHA